MGVATGLGSVAMSMVPSRVLSLVWRLVPVLLPSVETADFSGGPFVSAPTEASRLVLFRVRMFLGFFLMPGDGRDEHGGRPSCHLFLLQKARLLIRIVSLLPRRSTWGLC